MALDEIREIVSKDNETKHLKLSDNDMYVVYQYLLLRDDNALKGFRPKLVLEPYIHINYVPTKERQQEELTITLRQHLETFESDIYIADATLDDFIVSDEYQQKAIDYAKEFLKDPLKFQKGMYLYGEYNTGKSYLLSGIANELTKRRVNVVFVFVPDLIRSIKVSIGSDQLEKKINILKRCDVLILDDLGGENVSVWFRDEILLPIIHYRLNANLTVFISSNSSISELPKAMSLEKENDDVKVLRLIRRIDDLTKPFKLVKRFKKD